MENFDSQKKVLPYLRATDSREANHPIRTLLSLRPHAGTGKVFDEEDVPIILCVSSPVDQLLLWLQIHLDHPKRINRYAMMQFHRYI